jgi:uncharacterized protein YbjT (DUF2867 family)
MKLLLLGATGATGQQLVRLALEQGHDVTVLVRSPDKLRSDDPHLRVRVGSVMDPAAAEEAASGQEVVLITLGSNIPREFLRPPMLMTRSLSAIVPAMQHQRVNRVVLLSALGVGESARLAPALLRIASKTVLRRLANDKAAAEAHLRASGLDWTVVYSPLMADSPATGAYRSGEGLRIAGLRKISPADVAEFMLAQAGSTTYSRKNVVISP